MTRMEQLKKWLDGESVHNEDLNECCPDFSCCSDALVTKPEIKKKYIESLESDDLPTRSRFESEFIQAGIGAGLRVKSTTVPMEGVLSKIRVCARIVTDREQEVAVVTNSVEKKKKKE